MEEAQGSRILWIEDDAPQWASLVRSLRKDGYHVDFGTSLADGISYLANERNRYSLIILDNMVPDMADPAFAPNDVSDKGYFFASQMIRKEKIVGPVVVLTFFHPENEVLEEANDVAERIKIIPKDGYGRRKLKEILLKYASEDESEGGGGE